MRCLIIGGNRFVGLRLSLLLESFPGIELHILNRTGQAPHCRQAIVHKADRRNLAQSHLSGDWELVFDFACFNQKDAEGAVKFFAKKVQRYIFISSVSVYNPGANLPEAAFAPEDMDLRQPAATSYQEGKRRAEAVFMQQAEFAVQCVRFPFILGPDDYSRRLEFHVERVLRGEPLYVHNLKARFSVIHAEDAAAFLRWTVEQKGTGPLNVASAQPIAFEAMLQQIELVTGIQPKLATKPDADNVSPYSAPGDWFVSTKLINAAGFSCRPIEQWLPTLIGKPDLSPRAGLVH